MAMDEPMKFLVFVFPLTLSLSKSTLMIMRIVLVFGHLIDFIGLFAVPAHTNGKSKALLLRIAILMAQ